MLLRLPFARWGGKSPDQRSGPIAAGRPGPGGGKTNRQTMFQAAKPKSTFSLALNTIEVTYHATARKVREKHGNAVLSILISLVQSVLFVAAFYGIFAIMGVRSVGIRGDFLLYLMTGVFAFLTHIQTIRQIMGTESSTSGMMQHAPMNTLISLLSGAFSILYIKLLSLFFILMLLHTVFNPISIHYWPGALAMFFLAWGTGCVLGLVFYAAKPWIPDLIGIISMVYIRLNMIASGKMFVANTMPTAILEWFDWNPLFHIIDQARGFVFVNYFPNYSN
jgi:ABC-type polysaccharide/polyol phosphate export permease